MENIKYDLEERTQLFARNVRIYISKISKTVICVDDCKQVVRSSGSVAANYIEANESLSSKDFINRIKICRKEAKESHLWLSLLDIGEINQSSERLKLRQEALELTKIFGSIYRKYEKSKITKKPIL